MKKINNKWLMLLLFFVMIGGVFINTRERFSNKTSYPIGGNSVNPDMSNKAIGGDSVNPDTKNKNNNQQLLSTQIILLIIIIFILLYFIIVK